ncbi:MAG: hypothetical protein V1678_02960 [Candidatus Aenigmatarchaeota archaeon]
MHRALTLALTMVVLILGVLVIMVNPMEPSAIIFGMFMISVSILMISVQVYFPPVPEQTVELKVVEEPTVPVYPVKIVKPRRANKSRKVAKKSRGKIVKKKKR